jgi:heme exporter protein D
MMTSFSNFLRKYTAVPIVWLLFFAGLVWLGVGLMLIGFAARWLEPVMISTRLLLITAGILLATAIYLFGFSKLARKNIKRIRGMKGERVCLFAFQQRTSYPLVLFMIFLGIYLRVYSPFPKSLLAILYLGIGGGLFSSSLHYFADIAQGIRTKVNEVGPL